MALRHRTAIIGTAFVVALFGSLIGLIGAPWDNPPLFLSWNLLFLVWAIAMRWWLVAGGLIGLFGAVLTPVLDSPNIDRIVSWIVVGAFLGFIVDTLRRPEAKPPNRAGQPPALPSA